MFETERLGLKILNFSGGVVTYQEYSLDHECPFFIFMRLAKR